MTNNSAITPASAALCERVLHVKKAHRLTFDAIAAEAGMSRSTVINQINGRFNLDIRVVLAVARLCPDVPAEFLLRGRENLLSGNNTSMVNLESRVAVLEMVIKQIIDKSND